MGAQPARQRAGARSCACGGTTPATTAVEDGFDAADLEAANDASIVCVLVPDDVIPSLPLRGRPDGCTIVASGYTLAFDRLAVDGDLGMVAPRMLGPEVRRCYEEGVGFITAVGVHRDVTGRAHGARARRSRRRSAACARARSSSTHAQEAMLDLAVEQVLSPALTAVNSAFVGTMIEAGIPIEAIITELVLSGEVERTYRLLREVGYAVQSEFHSPTSQYGQLSRRGRYDHLDFGVGHARAHRRHRVGSLRRRVGRRARRGISATAAS